MRGKLWLITRAGLFLCFVVVLAALGPADAALAGPSTIAAGHEHKPEPKEQRDNEKLRDRMSKPATLNRRHQARNDGVRRTGRIFLRDWRGTAEPRRAELPDSGNGTHHDHLRFRHSPTMLQVVRN